MKLVKIMRELDGSLYRHGIDLKYSDHWLSIFDRAVSKGAFYSEDSFYNKTNLIDFYAEVEKDYFLFRIDAFYTELRIKHEIPEDLLEYTEAAYISNISDVIESITSELFFNITKKPLIRLTFDGPEELGLIWRLSI